MPDVPQPRNKIPFWAMPVLVALPLWAYVYQGTLEPAPTGEMTPIDLGQATYAAAACANCHMANGQGNAGVPGLGDVVETWPDYRDHMLWVRLGNGAWYAAAGESTYGATAQPSNRGTMPPHTHLSDSELAAVVLYERVELGGMEASGPDYDALVAIASGELTFAEAGLGDLASSIGIDDTEPD